ncbi:MAG: hypothetical protein M3Z17_02620 [Gemmatimonadota bacterium]|nr:hypothetical protein [Gemmatimonadota bacterium]
MESISASNGSAAPKKPALLKGGMIVCWIYAAMLALFLWMVPMLEDMARPGRPAMIPLPGLPSMQEMSAQSLDAIRLFIIPLLLLSIVVAYGLAKDRHWSRWVSMLLLVLGIVLIPPPLANATDYALSIALAIFGWWYLYRKANVVEYYAAIRNSN